MKNFFSKLWAKILVIVALLVAIGFGYMHRDDLVENSVSFFTGDFLVDKTATKKHGIKRTAKGTYVEQVKSAEDLMEAGYYEKARAELLVALRQKPDYILSYVRLGEVYSLEGNQTKLSALIKKTQELFPGNQQIQLLELRKTLAEGNYDRAMEILEASDEKFLDLQFYKGVLFSLQNRHEEAKKIFIEIESGKAQDISTLKEAKELDDTQVSKKILREAQAFSVAYDEFSEFAEGKNAHLFAKLAKILVDNDEAALGSVFAERTIKEDVTYPDGWILHGYALYLQKNYEDALPKFRKAYELDTIRPEVSYFLALTLTEVGELEEAVLFYEKALTYDFEFSEDVKWKLLEIFGKQQRYDRMLEIYQELLETSPKVKEDPKEFTKAIYTAIDLLKKPELALEITRKLLDKNSQDIFVINIHAWALIANDKYFEAGKMLEIAQKISPKNPRTFLNLGLLAEAQGQNAAAKEYYQKTYQLGKGIAGYTEIVNIGVENYNKIVEQEKNQKRQDSILNEHSP